MQVDSRPIAGAGKLPLGALRSAASLRWLFKHTRASVSWAALQWVIWSPPRFGSEVGNIISWQPKWVSALLHLLLSLDALRSNHGAWNFSPCLFSLMVLLIYIFLWSQKTIRSEVLLESKDKCFRKANPNSRSWFLFNAIYVKSEIIPLFAQICAWIHWKTCSSSSIPPAPCSKS